MIAWPARTCNARGVFASHFHLEQRSLGHGVRVDDGIGGHVWSLTGLLRFITLASAARVHLGVLGVHHFVLRGEIIQPCSELLAECWGELQLLAHNHCNHELVLVLATDDQHVQIKMRRNRLQEVLV